MLDPSASVVDTGGCMADTRNRVADTRGGVVCVGRLLSDPLERRGTIRLRHFPPRR